MMNNIILYKCYAYMINEVKKNQMKIFFINILKNYGKSNILISKDSKLFINGKKKMSELWHLNMNKQMKLWILIAKLKV